MHQIDHWHGIHLRTSQLRARACNMLARAIASGVELFRKIGITAHNAPRFLDVPTVRRRHIAHATIKDAIFESVFLKKQSHLVVLPVSAQPWELHVHLGSNRDGMLHHFREAPKDLDE